MTRGRRTDSQRREESGEGKEEQQQQAVASVESEEFGICTEGHLRVFRDIIELACRKLLQLRLCQRDGLFKEGVLHLAHLPEKVLLRGVDEGFDQVLIPAALSMRVVTLSSRA